jgi:hypothetical protein
MNQILGTLMGGNKSKGVNFNEMLEQFTQGKGKPAAKGKKPASKTQPTNQPNPAGDLLGALGKFLKQ